MSLTQTEVNRILRQKYKKDAPVRQTARPSEDPLRRRKSKLKMRFKHRLADEIARTEDKLMMLREIEAEQNSS